MTKTCIITECSTGLGSILATAVLARGVNPVATARTASSLDSLAGRYPGTVRTTALDVTKPGDAAAVALAEGAFGKLDIPVNNAGYGFLGAIEEGAADEYRPLFETNVFGLIETTRAAFPALRRTGGGRIVNLSSTAGIAGRAGSDYYCAAKFAVEGLSEALAEEVAPFGVAVIIVEPGPFRTDFLDRSINAAKVSLPAYDTTAGRMRSYRDSNDGQQDGDPKKAVAVIVRAVDAEEPPLHLPLGERAYSVARTKLAAFKTVTDAWEADAIATGF